MNPITELKQKILNANKAYREGNPIISDEHFDTLCESLQKQIPANDYKAFRETLFEKSGKIVHPYPMGSLAKFKYEEPETVCAWINGHVDSALNISAKVDGISCRLHYSNFMLESATTRGDGTKGEDITDKIRFVKEVPGSIDVPGEVDIRGELVIMSEDFDALNGQFANPRNATAGIMNRKDWDPKQIKSVSFVAYTIFGDKFTKKEQFEILEKNHFFVAWHKSFSIAELQAKTAKGFKNFNEELRGYVKQFYPYGTDGLVLSDDKYRNEDALIPENQIAFKVNDSVFETTVIDVEWGAPSKNGRMSPVLIVEPVEINGSVISRCTGNNLDYLEKMNIRYGSRVQIIKSGEVIPKIIAVVDNPESSVEITPPDTCPICGAHLIVDGVDLRCPNPECDSKQLASVVSFIRKFEVKHSAKKQLDNFGIKTIDDLIAFRPNPAYKSEKTLYDEIGAKIFTASPKKIFCAMNFKGLAEIQLGKIVDKYGLDWLLGLKFVNVCDLLKLFGDLPHGIGEASIKTFIQSLPDAVRETKKILEDPRYHYEEKAETKNATPVATRGSICFTGALETMGRKEAQALAESVGFEVKGGVNKGLTYLVIADPNSQSSKARKARELGTKLLSEKEFLAMCKGEEQNLDNL